MVLGACHIFKLIRHCLASYDILKDEDGDKINWNYGEIRAAVA